MKVQSLVSAMILTVGGLFLSHTYADALIDIRNNTLRPNIKQVMATRQVSQYLNDSHYLQVPLDEKKSPEILQMYLDSMDGAKIIFLKKDVAKFRKKYGKNLATMLRRGDLSAAFEIYDVYQERMTSYYKHAEEFLNKDHDLNTNKSYVADREEADYFAKEAEQIQYWENQLLSNLIDITLSQQEEKAKEDAFRNNPELTKGQDLIKNDTRSPVEILKKRIDRKQGLLSRAQSDSVLEGILNAALGSYDPHSNYYAPIKATEMNIQSNLALEGIGVSIRPDRKNPDYTKIVRVLDGGPASKTGQVQSGEFIVGVSKPDGTMVDVVGWTVQEVVGLIRGKRGTKVSIQLLKPGANQSSARTVTIIRDLIEQEEQGVQSRSFDLEYEGEIKKIGVLEIPSFYFDYRAYYRGENYRSVSKDTAVALKKLNKEGIDALVVDLRNNPGGALNEVDAMLGDFIKEGPVVQIRNSREEVEVLKDTDGGRQLYDKPMAVLINLGSASASEIFAAAIQDYNRGIIVGSTTTGKGSAQLKRDSLVHGQMTITQKKFYRVTGGSTQNKGVIPDIELVNIYDENSGERAQKHALEWDTIKTAAFKPEMSFADMLPVLKERSQSRVLQNPQFQYLQALKDLGKAQDEENKTVHLNMEKRAAKVKESEQKSLAIENERRVAMGEKPYATWEIYRAALDARTEERSNMKFNERPKLPEEEAFVVEAASILMDQMRMTDKK